MTEDEIKKELDKDLMKFYNAPYQGELPKNILELFRMAVFHIPPAIHQIHVVRLRDLLTKKMKDLTVADAGIMLKTIMDIEPKILYVTMEEYLVTQEVMEKAYIAYNLEAKKFGERQDRKRQSLITLGGQRNGMKILRN